MKKKHKLDPIKVGKALGMWFSTMILLLGICAGLFGWGMPVIHIINSIYLGFEANIPGIIIGMIWGFFDGFIGGYIFAWIYNRL